ncbi:DUF6701 domain-containing protein [Marinobacter santoriniensis]|uniref:DUF6701 domain-containing protein n=1 Tax=Marinobacter santoriniensis TaxID=523742 RepID=UPI001D0D2AEB|nr:DUF6701 domain-containing protein [Marinobacter santoriniensis]
MTPNLQASGHTLDLGSVPFANNAWPQSGTTLADGDYYFSSTNLPNNYRLNIASGASVRIFVNGSLASGNGLMINSNGNADQLLLVVKGSLSLGNNAELRGLVYATGSVGVGNNGNVDGGIAAGGAIYYGNNSRVTADYSGVSSGLLTGLCNPAIVLSANGQSTGPVRVNVGETVTFSVTARGCPSAEPSFWSDDWIDSWFLDGSSIGQAGFNSSPCDRAVEKTHTFNQTGTFTVAFESRYCSDSGYWGLACRNYSVFGRDDIQIDVGNPTGGLTCFDDQFSSSTLDANDWVTSVSKGSFTPGVTGNGRLRMTEAASNQATAATLQREIPGADNLIVLEFDYYAYGGSGADGVAVVLSDALITPQPGSYGGSLGYAQRNNGDSGFAGGWLGIGLDEFGNFSNRSEGRVGGNSGRTPDSVAVRGSAPDYAYLADSGQLNPGVDATGQSSPHRYRITVDSRAGVGPIATVERDTSGTGNNFSQLVRIDLGSVASQSTIPENLLLSLTGSTGGSNNIHELDNVQLCALKLNPVGQQVDHFEIVHDGVALTCQSETVTVRACANAACDQLFTDPVNATLAPSSGWAGGNVLSISGGTAQASLQHTTAGNVRLNVVGSQPSTRPQSVTLCDNGSGGLSSSKCSLPFYDSGLAFDVPDLTSHKPESSIQVRAVRRDNQTDACVPAFENVRKPVSFWSTYVDPGAAGRPASRPLSVNGTEIGGSQTAATTLDLDFGAGGVAQIDVMYPDAGRMNLNALYLGSAATGDSGLEMPGADSFVSIPAGLCVRSAGECLAGDSTCPRFKKAGESFDLTVQAVGWEGGGDTDLCQGNPTTPNFSLSGIPLTSSLVAPSGGAPGTVVPASYSHGASSTATQTVATRVSEVGVFRFLATPGTGAYLGRTVPGGTSAPIGRFYPDRFEVTTDPGELQAECSAGGSPFTYTGEPFGWKVPASLSIEPVSVQGSRTLNYTAPGFRKLVAGDVDRVFPGGDSTAVDVSGSPVSLTTTPVTGGLTVSQPGLLSYQYSMADQFAFDKSVGTRISPFLPDLSFQVSDMTDSDGVSAAATPYTFNPTANFDIRYGRLFLENAYGPETLAALPMPFRAEYWNGSGFVTNTADSCTAWTTTDITDTENHHSLSAASGTLSAGLGGPLSLVPDGSQGTDSLVWNVADWLAFDQDGDGTLEDPSALATFGVYRGNDRVIYWQEQ